MNTGIKYSKMLFLVLLLVAFAAGCGDNNNTNNTVPPLSSAKAITAYSLSGSSGAIDETAKTIAVTLPYGTSRVNLIAVFTTTGVSVKVNGVLQTSGYLPANDFTNPVVYTVTAAERTTATYTVTVTVALSSSKSITAYSIVSQLISTITGTAIAVTMPASTPSVTALVATFSTSGASVMVSGVTQTSGSTPNDFTYPVVYRVNAADSTFTNYTVTVTKALAPPAPSLNLRSTANFAVLAGSSITSTGTVTVTGDVGYGTGGAPAISFVTGTTYISTDLTYTTAMADLALVISDATSTILFPCGSSISGNLTGVVLTPGVTCITSDAAILNTGVVTLNGAGEYMVRTGGALTPAASSSVAYGGTANATNTNVVWVVGSASLGSPSTWMGTILATTGAVTLGDTDTLIKGRVMTTNAVTLSNNVITKP